MHFPSYGGWGGTNPLQGFIDEFPCTDGKPSYESAVYNPEKPYENRDPRFLNNCLICAVMPPILFRLSGSVM